MKEYAVENRNNEKLPVIKQGSQQKLQIQTKLHRLLCQISNKNSNADHLRSQYLIKQQETFDKTQRILLKNTSTLSKINLRPKGEDNELTKISKKVELQTINGNLLTKNQSNKPIIQNQVKGPSLRVSVNIQQHIKKPSIDQNQPQIESGEAFINSLQNFLTNNLSIGVLFKDLSSIQSQQ